MTTARSAAFRPGTLLLFWWLLIAGLVVPFDGGARTYVRAPDVATRSLAETDRRSPVALRAEALAQLAIASRKRSGDGARHDDSSDADAHNDAFVSGADVTRISAIARPTEPLIGGSHIRPSARGPPTVPA